MSDEDKEFNDWFEVAYPKLGSILSDDDVLTIYRAARRGWKAAQAGAALIMPDQKFWACLDKTR